MRAKRAHRATGGGHAQATLDGVHPLQPDAPAAAPAAPPHTTVGWRSSGPSAVVAHLQAVAGASPLAASQGCVSTLFPPTYLGWGSHWSPTLCAHRRPSRLSPFRSNGLGRAVGVEEPPTPQLWPNVRNFLQRPQAAMWLRYEWFQSTLDDAALGVNEFQLCLRDLGFGDVGALTRAQWNGLRRLIGKRAGRPAGRPRRLSPAFLAQERHQLELRRAKIRRLQKSNGLVRPARPRLSHGH